MLSCLPVSLFPELISGTSSIERWANYAAELGLDAFDISILFVRDRTPRGISQLRAQVEASGLPLAMVATYPDFTVPDRICWEREVKKAISDIAVATELGAQYVRITAGQYYPERPVDLEIDQICAAFGECAEYAQRWGVRLLWENHSKPGAWDHIDFDFDEERFLRLYERLKGGPVMLNYDIANAYLLGCGPELLKMCFTDVASIHINDVASVEPLCFTGVGKGRAPILQTFQFLIENGYRGHYAIEEASGNGWRGVADAVETTKRLLYEAGLQE